MTYRELLHFIRQHADDHPDDEALDREVIVRVEDGDELHIGGLRSASIDAGCTDEPALTLDADQDDDTDDDLEDDEDTVSALAREAWDA